MKIKLVFIPVSVLLFSFSSEAGIFGRVVGKVDEMFKMNTTGKVYTPQR